MIPLRRESWRIGINSPIKLMSLELHKFGAHLKGGFFMPTPIVPEIIENKIFLIRGQKVMIDRDLAQLYEVTTKALNQAVKRNRSRFPGEFMFRLTMKEKNELVTNCDRFANLKHSTSLPYAFTEHGVAMLSSVLNSDRAIQANIAIIKIFIRLREILGSHKALAEKIKLLEKKYDSQFRVVFEAIRQLMKEEE